MQYVSSSISLDNSPWVLPVTWTLTSLWAQFGYGQYQHLLGENSSPTAKWKQLGNINMHPPASRGLLPGKSWEPQRGASPRLVTAEAPKAREAPQWSDAEVWIMAYLKSVQPLQNPQVIFLVRFKIPFHCIWHIQAQIKHTRRFTTLKEYFRYLQRLGD